MANTTEILLYMTAALLVLLMLVQGWQRKVELLSIRNLYLAGFIIYQLVGPATAEGLGRAGVFHVELPGQSLRWVLCYAIVFLAIFLYVYHHANPGRWLARRLFSRPSLTPRETSDATLLLIAIILAGTALPLRFLVAFPVLHFVAYHTAIGFAAVAIALVGWVWIRRPLNPMVILVAVAVFSCAAPVALYSTFGRRALIAVSLAFGWGVYYSLGRRVSPAKIIIWATPAFLAAALLVCAYSAVRGEMRGADVGIGQTLRLMTQADIATGAKDVLGGQLTGGATLWAMESYPERIERRHLFSLQQMVYQFVPRMWWAEKPIPLANHVARLAHVDRVHQGRITLPPGVLGYANAEGGMYALVVYAFFFASLTRFFDELIRLNVDNAFFVAAAGCATGHFIGLARGDLANFTVNVILSFTGTLLLMLVLNRWLGKPVHRYIVVWQYGHHPGHGR